MMKKIKSVLKWIVWNVPFAFAVYFGIYKHIEGVDRIAFFLAWVFIVLCLYQLPKSSQALMRKNGRSVPVWIDIPFDMAIVFVFIWHSAWVTGSFYFLHMWIQQGCWINALKEADENKEPDVSK